LPLRSFLLCSTFWILASMDVVFCLACACCTSAAAAAPRMRDAVQQVEYGKARGFAPALGSCADGQPAPLEGGGGVDPQPNDICMLAGASPCSHMRERRRRHD
jgi:hypothetical protein